MTKVDVVNFLSSHKQELQEKFGITKLALFGSYARDEQTEDSDIDLAIVEMEKNDYFKRVHAKYYLEKELQKGVDIGYLKSMRNFIKRRVEKELIYV
ncbi:nucleotidyltransferase family protein [Sulfurimonas sp.]|uniref:nucleotidyltransferase family protein n=1 Tax=Sulfurimonas sp. TaxID=2022749 RepID=UPI003D0CA8DA